MVVLMVGDGGELILFDKVSNFTCSSWIYRVPPSEYLRTRYNNDSASSVTRRRSSRNRGTGLFSQTYPYTLNTNCRYFIRIPLTRFAFSKLFIILASDRIYYWLFLIFSFLFSFSLARINCEEIITLPSLLHYYIFQVFLLIRFRISFIRVNYFGFSEMSVGYNWVGMGYERWSPITLITWPPFSAVGRILYPHLHRLPECWLTSLFLTDVHFITYPLRLTVISSSRNEENEIYNFSISSL